MVAEGPFYLASRPDLDEIHPSDRPAKDALRQADVWRPVSIHQHIHTYVHQHDYVD